MSRFRQWAALLVLAAAFGCSEGGVPPTGTSPTAEHAQRLSLEHVAMQFAVALRNPAFRAHVKATLDTSTVVEHKLHFQRFLLADGQRALRAFARAAGVDSARLEAEVLGAIPVELYLPVPAHREAWTGDERILVATAMKDRDAPVAFDLAGRRYVLSPDGPPETPVLVVVPVETDFDRPSGSGPRPATCLEGECGGGGGQGGGGLQNALVMTYAEFVQDFEGWFKGKPEFEIHILGPASQSELDKLVSFQCIGEHSSPPYYWDMNELTWSGTAQLFSHAQMDAFEQSYPGRAYLIYALEDDDQACKIIVDQDKARELIAALKAAYDQWIAAKDKKLTYQRLLEGAQTGSKLIKAVANFITTNDDIIGFALESGVTGRYHPTGNWVVLDKDTNENGWLRLEMR